MKKLIELDNLTKEFNGQVVLKGIHLDIHENEFMTLLGPSGCGKTTTLRIVGGFEEASSGEVLFDGIDISTLPPYKREVNTVFQKYALFPHMNVFDNIAFGLKIKKLDKDIVRQKVMRMLSLVGLEGFEKRNISSRQIEEIVNSVERTVRNELKQEVPTEVIGNLIMEELRKLDQVAYVRFASVYREFKDLSSFMSELETLMKNGKTEGTDSKNDQN